MLSAGWDAKAARWSPIVDDMGGEAGDRAWALLALGSPTPRVDMRVARINRFLDNDASAENMRGRMLFAALAGLGRIRGNARGRIADDMDVDLDGHNRWSLMLERAVRNGQPGTVVLLAGDRHADRRLGRRAAAAFLSHHQRAAQGRARI